MVKQIKKKKPIGKAKKPSAIKPLDDLFNLLGEDDDESVTIVHDDDDDDDGHHFKHDLEDGHEVLDLEQLIYDELDNARPISKDLRIDDSSMPIAKNFLQFANDESFLSSTPYLEQAIIGIKLFAEYCPRPECSDLKWFSDDGHSADEPLATLSRKVSLLHHGVCPKCGARKSELIASGELNFYNELVVVAGQRCVTGDTHIFTGKGIERIGDLVPRNAKQGYNDFKYPVFNGEKLETTKEFYITKAEHVYTLQLDNGSTLSGTLDHPVRVEKFGYRALHQIKAGEQVVVQTGQNCWGNLNCPYTVDELRSIGSDITNRLDLLVDTVAGKGLHPDLLKYSMKNCREFLRGVFDNNTTQYPVAYHQLVKDVYALLLNIGILPTIQNTSETISISISNENRNILFDDHRSVKRNRHLLSVVSCGVTDRTEVMYDVTMPITQHFITNGIDSHNSGKSAVVTMISAYIVHLFLMCGKPTELFNIRNNEILHGTFLALTLGQATQNLWEPFLGYINNSPWFKAYHLMLRRYEKKYGEVLLKLKDTFIDYRHRNLKLYPATPDKRVLRGRTRILGALDELGWFDSNRDSKKVKDNAHEVYKAMSNSLATARQSEKRLVEQGFDQFMLTGYMLNVSSPNNIRDKIMELYKQSLGSRKMLGLHRPTWKMNPHIPFDGELIREEYRKDPIGAARDFGAEPSLSSNPFMSNHRLLEETVRTSGKNWVKYALKTIRISRDEKHRTVELLNVKQNGSRSVMAIDAGFSNNCFAIVCGSLHDGIPHMDCLLEINALPGIPISFTSVFADAVLPLIEQRNCSILLADRWNSIKLLQDAQATYDSLKVSGQYSLRYNDMYEVKTAIEMGQFKIPNIEDPSIKNILASNLDDYPACFEGRPVHHLLLQLATVVDVGKKSVEKGNGFTDDLWRAAALCYFGLTNPDYQEHLVGEVESKKVQPPLALLKKLTGGMNALTVTTGNKTYSGSTKFIGVKRTGK